MDKTDCLSQHSNSSLRQLFLLKRGLIYLNHGAYGACPLPVLRAWQKWQLEIEQDPSEFFTYRHGPHMRRAREALAGLVGCAAHDLVYVANATTGLNIAIRSLALRRGDEILASDQEYGAIDKVWRYVCEKSGARYRRVHVRIPVTRPLSIVDDFVSAVTARTKVIFISHVAAPSGFIFRLKEVIDFAARRGIITIVDGAHALGQVPVDLGHLNPDVYVGSAHKWLCAPRGSAFLYVKKSLQSSVTPGVISWGWREEAQGVSQLVRENQWQGTRDVAAYLATMDAIEFQKEHNWDRVRKECHDQLVIFQKKITEHTGVAPICESDDGYGQMLSLRLPGCDVFQVAKQLRENYGIAVQPFHCGEMPLMRVCFQGYNTSEELDLLADLLKKIAAPAFRII